MVQHASKIMPEFSKRLESLHKAFPAAAEFLRTICDDDQGLWLTGTSDAHIYCNDRFVLTVEMADMPQPTIVLSPRPPDSPIAGTEDGSSRVFNRKLAELEMRHQAVDRVVSRGTETFIVSSADDNEQFFESLQKILRRAGSASLALESTDRPALVLVRELVTDAEAMLTTDESRLQRFKAILLLDLAIERMLNTILSDTLHELGESEPNNARKDFGSLWREADSRCRKVSGLGLRFHTQILSMHNARNRAQHHGEFPDSSTVRTAAQSATAFLRASFMQVYCLSFANFSHVELIENPALRQILGEVREMLDEGDFKWAAIGCIGAYRQLVTALSVIVNQRATHEATERGVRFRNVLGSRSSNGKELETLKKDIEVAFARTGEELDEIRVEFAEAALGLSMSDLRRFRRMASTVKVLGTDPQSRWIGWNVRELPVWRADESPPFDEDSARFMFAHLSRMAQRVEEVYPPAGERFAIVPDLHAQRLKHEPIHSGASSKSKSAFTDGVEE